MYGKILKSLNIVNLYRGMSKLKLKINVKVPQLLCIVVSVALNGEFERFGGFCFDCYFLVTVNILNAFVERIHIDFWCLPFVRIIRLGRALINGKRFSKITKPTERNGAYHLQFDFPSLFSADERLKTGTFCKW